MDGKAGELKGESDGREREDFNVFQYVTPSYVDIFVFIVFLNEMCALICD